jgi:ATP adenylyltransferase
MSGFRQNLFIPEKKAYVMGTRPDVECILCSVIAGDPSVKSLEIYRNDLVLISANIYPYNPGHLMVVPLRHVEDPRKMTVQELNALDRGVFMSMDILDSMYGPQGYNVGYNFGYASGASIAHFHRHVVPRFARELGFFDILSGARIIVEDPLELVNELRRRFDEYESSISSNNKTE